MITIGKIADKYEEIYGADSVAGLATTQFQDLSFKEQFNLLEFAKGQDIVLKQSDDEIDGGKIIYSGSKDKDFNFHQMLKDIETKV